MLVLLLVPWLWAGGVEVVYRVVGLFGLFVCVV